MTRSFSARLGLIVRQPIMIDRVVQGAWPCVILGAVYRLSTPEAKRSYARGPISVCLGSWGLDTSDNTPSVPDELKSLMSVRLLFATTRISTCA